MGNTAFDNNNVMSCGAGTGLVIGAVEILPGIEIIIAENGKLP